MSPSPYRSPEPRITPSATSKESAEWGFARGLAVWSLVCAAVVAFPFAVCALCDMFQAKTRAELCALDPTRYQCVVPWGYSQGGQCDSDGGDCCIGRGSLDHTEDTSCYGQEIREWVEAQK
jgi:hypothetical protein